MGVYYVCFTTDSTGASCNKIYELTTSFRFQRRTSPQLIEFPGADATQRLGFNLKGVDETYTFSIVLRNANTQLASIYNDLRTLVKSDVTAYWYFVLKYSTANNLSGINPASDQNIIGPFKVFIDTATLDLSAGQNYATVSITVRPVR